jgi:hypothetical protein
MDFRGRRGVQRIRRINAYQARRAFNTSCVSTPATSPQNAEPIDSKVSPEAVTMNVTNAASRCFTSCIALARPLMIEPNSASAATETTSALGSAANNAAMVAPNVPAIR